LDLEHQKIESTPIKPEPLLPSNEDLTSICALRPGKITETFAPDAVRISPIKITSSTTSSSKSSLKTENSQHKNDMSEVAQNSDFAVRAVGILIEKVQNLYVALENEQKARKSLEYQVDSLSRRLQAIEKPKTPQIDTDFANDIKNCLNLMKSTKYEGEKDMESEEGQKLKFLNDQLKKLENEQNVAQNRVLTLEGLEKEFGR